MKFCNLWLCTDQPVTRQHRMCCSLQLFLNPWRCYKPQHKGKKSIINSYNIGLNSGDKIEMEVVMLTKKAVFFFLKIPLIWRNKNIQTLTVFTSGKKKKWFEMNLMIMWFSDWPLSRPGFGTSAIISVMLVLIKRYSAGYSLTREVQHCCFACCASTCIFEQTNPE